MKKRVNPTPAPPVRSRLNSRQRRNANKVKFAEHFGCNDKSCESTPPIANLSRSITGGSRGIDDDVHGGTTQQHAIGTHLESKPLELASAGAEGEQEDSATSGQVADTVSRFSRPQTDEVIRAVGRSTAGGTRMSHATGEQAARLSAGSLCTGATSEREVVSTVSVGPCNRSNPRLRTAIDMTGTGWNADAGGEVERDIANAVGNVGTDSSCRVPETAREMFPALPARPKVDKEKIEVRLVETAEKFDLEETKGKVKKEAIHTHIAK